MEYAAAPTEPLILKPKRLHLSRPDAPMVDAYVSEADYEAVHACAMEYRRELKPLRKKLEDLGQLAGKLKSDNERLECEVLNLRNASDEAMEGFLGVRIGGPWPGIDQLRGIVNELKRRRAEAERLQAAIEQLQVQLAGCSVAAIGGSSAAEVKVGDYAYSASFEDVRGLRAEVEQLRAKAERLEPRDKLEDLLRGAALMVQQAIDEHRAPYVAAYEHLVLARQLIQPST